MTHLVDGCGEGVGELTAIEVVVGIAGSQRALADVLRLKQPSNVSQWVNGIRKVPTKHFDAIERLTDNRVTRAQLRPDIFGGATGIVNAA